MTCEECREWLWTYLEWETTPEESAEIKAHLAGCPECRRAAAKKMGVLETLHSFPETELPEGYHAELMQRVAVEAMAAAVEQRALQAVPVPALRSGQPAPERKAEKTPEAKPQKTEKKPESRWRRRSLVAAALLVVVAAGGIKGMLAMRQEPMERMRTTAATENSDEARPEDAADSGRSAAAGAAEQKSMERESRKTVPDLAAENASVEEALADDADLPAAGSIPMPTAEAETANLAEPRTAPALNGTASLRAEAALPEIEEDAEEGIAGFSGYSAAQEQKPGDLLTLRTEKGDAAYASLSRAVARNAGFEGDAENPDAVLAMIPVENMDAFYEELEEIGQVEWQAQGQEEIGASYRRVEILLEKE